MRHKFRLGTVRLLSLLPLLLLAPGCVHQINISPDLDTLDRSDIKTVTKNVGYYISRENFEKKVTKSMGGGDKVENFGL